MNLSNRYLQSGSYRERSWSKIYETLKEREKELNPEELYQLALAAYLTGHDLESIDILATHSSSSFLKMKRSGRQSGVHSG